MRKLILTCLLLTAVLSAFPIYFKHIGTKEGLSQLSVMSVYQDELGRMWFGTQEGLSMYDGEHVVSFKPPISIENNNYPIEGDKKGNIYFKSDNSLIRYDNRLEKFECLKEKNVTTVASHNDTIWVGVADSVCVWDTVKNELRFVFKATYTIQKLFIDKQNSCWIGTEKGLYFRDKNNLLICIIPNEDIYELMDDSHGNLWIATRANGMYKRDKAGNIIKFVHDPRIPNTISDNQVRSFAEDNLGNLWIGTFTGLNKYNPVTGQFSVYTKDALPGSLTHASVFSTYKDSQGSIWVGTYYGGVHYFNPETDIFTYYTEDATRNDCLSCSYVGHMLEDCDGNIWMCTEGGGLNFFNRKTKRFTHFLSDNSKNSIAHNNLKSICYSTTHNKIYIGTHTGGLSIYNLSTNTFKNPYNDDPFYRKLAGDVVNQIAFYKDEYLVIKTRYGFLKMNLDTEQFSPLFEDSETFFAINFTIDSKGYIWIAKNDQIIKMNLANHADKTIYLNGENGLGHFGISKIMEDSKGRMFFGTFGSGLYYYDEVHDRFIGYTAEKNQFQSNYCYDIVQSQQGYLIISGDKGLSFFDPEQLIVKAVELGTALPISGINNGCGLLVCRNGEVFVGGIDGVASFFEQELFSSAKDYNLYFSALYINNDRVHPGEPGTVLTEALPYTEKIELAHGQNNLLFTFFTNNYVNTLKKTAYEYRLEGFDTKWISSSGKSIAYTNLSPGKYTLIVREKQFDPYVAPKTIQLDILIHAPLYATPLFYLLYVLVTLGIIYSFIRFKQSQLVLQTSLKIERKEKEHIEEMNLAKLQFFSNISHEFRTPLTLIISQIELLLQSNSLAPSVYNKILKVYKNTHHMRNLISELLDFRKLEQGYVTLNVCEQNIVPFLKEIYLSFYEYATGRSISYTFDSTNEDCYCWYDAKQLQKVFFNLISNAFNYTKTTGFIEVMITDFPDEIQIKVIDSGTGIAEKDIYKIFNRFYQADNGAGNTSKTFGTGIGLSLSKSIVELHHGRIQVESTPGYGSIFIVYLRKGRAHFGSEECAFSDTPEELVQTDTVPESQFSEKSEENVLLGDVLEQAPSRSILIVEDNEELLELLDSLFAPTYRVLLACNGKDGLEKAMDEKPDIILSDIMMPEMSGTEMCLKIKNNFDLCHIPVVLLTALTSSAQNMEGLQRGADDYIGKPFNAGLLVARCNNLVRNRIILQNKFSMQQNFDTQALAGNPIDQRFLDTVNQIIEQNLDNMEFDMNTLARELGLSRSSLYAKFKALTGMTPNGFVLNNKLKRAAQLLTNNPDLQIAEISDRLGFGSPRYFSRCFKEQFNVTPAEYRKKQKEE